MQVRWGNLFWSALSPSALLPFSRYFLVSVPSAVSFFNAQLLEHVFSSISTSNGPSSHLLGFMNQKLHNWLMMLKVMPFQLNGWNRKLCQTGSEMPRGPDCNPSLIALAVVQKPGRCNRFPNEVRPCSEALHNLKVVSVHWMVLPDNNLSHVHVTMVAASVKCCVWFALRL